MDEKQKRHRYLPSMALRRDELEELAQTRFAFLMRDKGFVSRESERQAQWTMYYYADGRASIGVEIQLDYRDEDVRLYLLRLRDGELPPRGFVDAARGERYRISFLSLLKDVLRLGDAQLNDLSVVLSTPEAVQPHDHQWADELLARWQDLVERHIDLVEQQPVEALFPPPPPGTPAWSQAL